MDEQPNERRADLGAAALRAGCLDWGANDLLTDASDALANIRHWCDREAVDFAYLIERGLDTYEGDSEDGPPAKSPPN